MIAFEGKTFSIDYNSIPLENISVFDKNSAYVQGSQRIYGTSIFEAIIDIPKTVNHIWYDIDPLNIYGFDLYTNDIIPDSTAVPIVDSVTLVYVKSLKKYFLASATTTVNYSTMNWNTPTNFTDLGTTPSPLYRIELNYPLDKKNTLLWEYKGGINRNTMFDSIINKRSINNRFAQITDGMTISISGMITLNSPLSENIYELDKIKITGTLLNNGIYKITSISLDRLYFIVDSLMVEETIVSGSVFLYTQTYIKWVDFGIDKIAILNTVCESVELKVSTTGFDDTYTIDSMYDSSFITTFQIFCFNEPTLKLNHIINIIPNFNQDFELTFFGNFQEIGELIQGKSLYIGKAEDTVILDGKNYNPLVEADNGDVYLQDETRPINILDGKRISLIYPSTQTSNYKDMMKTLMSKRLVISGDIGDNEDLPFLLSYCFIKSYSFNPEVNHEYNKFNIETRELL